MYKIFLNYAQYTINCCTEPLKIPPVNWYRKQILKKNKNAQLS